MDDVTIIGIRRCKGVDGQPTGRWAVVGQRTEVVEDSGPGDYTTYTITVLVSEHETKRDAICAGFTRDVID